MISLLLGLPLLLGGIGASSINYTDTQNEVIRQENKKYASFDDDGGIITLTAQELTNYTFNNLNDYFMHKTDELTADLNQCDFYNLTYGAFEIAEVVDTIAHPQITYTNNTYLFGFNCNGALSETYTTNKFYFWNNEDVVVNAFDIMIDIGTDSIYQSLKTAIQADIADNQVMPSYTDLFEVIGNGVTGFIGALSNAFNSVVTLFWGTDGPTFLGMLVLLGIGAGLIYLAFRLIRGAIQRLRG